MDEDDVAAVELRLARSRFMSVAVDWCLTRDEVWGLLGVSPGPTSQVLPPRLDADGEMRMRLVIELEHGLHALMSDEEAVAWLRTPASAFDGLSPLQAASADLASLRGLRDIVRAARSVD